VVERFKGGRTNVDDAFWAAIERNLC